MFIFLGAESMIYYFVNDKWLVLAIKERKDYLGNSIMEY